MAEAEPVDALPCLPLVAASVARTLGATDLPDDGDRPVMIVRLAVCTENLIRVDDVMESTKLAE